MLRDLIKREAVTNSLREILGKKKPLELHILELSRVLAK
jgi:hypothetical protein